MLRESFKQSRERYTSTCITTEPINMINVLQDIVNGYNKTVHRSIKQSPASINKDNEVKVWAQQYLPEKSTKVKYATFKFSNGDLVRVSQSKEPIFPGIWTDLY